MTVAVDVYIAGDAGEGHRIADREGGAGRRGLITHAGTGTGRVAARASTADRVAVTLAASATGAGIADKERRIADGSHAVDQAAAVIEGIAGAASSAGEALAAGGLEETGAEGIAVAIIAFAAGAGAIETARLVAFGIAAFVVLGIAGEA